MTRGMTLADLAHLSPARVASFAPGSEHAIALMQLGMVPGSQVRVVRAAPFGCPLQVDVDGAHLAIRRSVAASVMVEPLESHTA